MTHMAETIVICPTENELQRASQRNVKCYVSGCEQHFSTLPALWMHSAKTHHVFKDETYRAAISCNKKADRSKSVTKQFVCPVSGCPRGRGQGKPFARLTILKTHYINQHAEKRFPCEKCGSKFGSASYLDVHASRCGQLFKCSCGAPYTTPEALYMHAKRRKHELTDEFKESRKYKWRRKDLEAEALGTPVPETARKRSTGIVPLLPKGPVFILHRVVTPAKTTNSTQTDREPLTYNSLQRAPGQTSSTPARTKDAGVQNDRHSRVDQNAGEVASSPRDGDGRSVQIAAQQFQTLASSLDPRLVNFPYNVIQVISNEQPPASTHQTSQGHVTTSSYSYFTNNLSSSPLDVQPAHIGELRSQAPLTYPNPSSAVANMLSGPNAHTANLIPFANAPLGLSQSMVPTSSSGGMSSNHAAVAAASSNVYHYNVVAMAASGDQTPEGNPPIASYVLTSLPAVPRPLMAPPPNGSQSSLNSSLADSSTSTESNDSINFRSIGTTFETLGVPTQTDFNLLDLFESCDNQTQTIESIFACSPVVRETSATQTQLQELRSSTAETVPTATDDAQTLVENLLQGHTHQAAMQTQPLAAERSTLETQTPGTPRPLPTRTVEFQTMTHSSIATSPCCQQPVPGQRRETQETQTMAPLSSQDLLSLDIYTQTGLDAVDDLADRTSLDDLEFADIHTQTMDDFDLGIFGIDANSASVQTDLPLVRAGGSHTVGMQVQSQCLERDTDVQTDTASVGSV